MGKGVLWSGFKVTGAIQEDKTPNPGKWETNLNDTKKCTNNVIVNNYNETVKSAIM